MEKRNYAGDVRMIPEELSYKIDHKKLIVYDYRYNKHLKKSEKILKDLSDKIFSPPPIPFDFLPENVDYNNTQSDKFQKYLENLRYKIRSITYSIALLEEEINSPPILNMTLPIKLDETEFLSDVIVFEFEAFLFQIYSALDIFSGLLGLLYENLWDEKDRPSFLPKNRKAGYGLAEKLSTSEPNLAQYIREQSDIWIQNIYDLRNRIAHNEKIEELQIFLLKGSNLYPPTISISDRKSNLMAYTIDTSRSFTKLIYYIETNFLLEKSKGFYKK